MGIRGPINITALHGGVSGIGIMIIRQYRKH
jgi:hypothetical protein